MRVPRETYSDGDGGAQPADTADQRLSIKVQMAKEFRVLSRRKEPDSSRQMVDSHCAEIRSLGLGATEPEYQSRFEWASSNRTSRNSEVNREVDVQERGVIQVGRSTALVSTIHDHLCLENAYFPGLLLCLYPVNSLGCGSRVDVIRHLDETGTKKSRASTRILVEMLGWPPMNTDEEAVLQAHAQVGVHAQGRAHRRGQLARMSKDPGSRLGFGPYLEGPALRLNGEKITAFLGSSSLTRDIFRNTLQEAQRAACLRRDPDGAVPHGQDARACEYDAERPDMVLMGKALSGSVYPVSAVLADRDILLCIKPGEHGSTYGGQASTGAHTANTPGCAVALTALRVLLDSILALRSPSSRASRARDAQRQAKITRGRAAWQSCLLSKSPGVLAKPTHVNIVRFAPPLVISEEDLLRAVKIIGECLVDLDQLEETKSRASAGTRIWSPTRPSGSTRFGESEERRRKQRKRWSRGEEDKDYMHMCYLSRSSCVHTVTLHGPLALGSMYTKYHRYGLWWQPHSGRFEAASEWLASDCRVRARRPPSPGLLDSFRGAPIDMRNPTALLPAQCPSADVGNRTVDRKLDKGRTWEGPWRTLLAATGTSAPAFRGLRQFKCRGRWTEDSSTDAVPTSEVHASTTFARLQTSAGAQFTTPSSCLQADISPRSHRMLVINALDQSVSPPCMPIVAFRNAHLEVQQSDLDPIYANVSVSCQPPRQLVWIKEGRKPVGCLGGASQHLACPQVVFQSSGPGFLYCDHERGDKS
ncbi:hypothetical protein C8R47DRAFT_1070373 [Mycena vitilis]|nr:hypothetical protein C8R47DRAFT_1070373 [Mycena vitilis]